MSEPMKMDPIAMQIGKITVVTQSHDAESGAALIRVTRPGESDSFSKINVDGTCDVAFTGDKNPREGGEQRALDVLWSLLKEHGRDLRGFYSTREERRAADAKGDDDRWFIDGQALGIQVTTLPLHELWREPPGTTVPITIDRVHECVQQAIDKKAGTATGYQRNTVLVVDGRDVGTVLLSHPTSAWNSISVSGEWAGVYLVGPTPELSVVLKPLAAVHGRENVPKDVPRTQDSARAIDE